MRVSPCRSAIAPCLTSLTLETITTSSTVCSTSWSMWSRDQDGLALGAEVAQEAAQPADALGVEAVGRLVEDEHLRVAEHSGGQAEPLAHAHRVPAGRLRAAAGCRSSSISSTVGRRPRRCRPGPAGGRGRCGRGGVGRLQGGPHHRHGLRDVGVAVATDDRGAVGRPDQAEQHAKRWWSCPHVGARGSR